MVPQDTNSIVLITGAAKRLGAAMALGLAADGWDVVVHYRSSESAALETAERVRELGRRAWTIQADLEDAEVARALVGRTRELAGGVHALINNASIFPGDSLQTLDPALLERNIALHAIAPTLLTRALAEDENARHVIHILDSRITGPDPEHLSYHLSKRMLFSLTRAMAVEWAPRLCVNAIAPGAVLAPTGGDEAALLEVAKDTPLQRAGTPDCVADAARSLLASRSITGQVLFVDCGRHLRGSLYG